MRDINKLLDIDELSDLNYQNYLLQAELIEEVRDVGRFVVDYKCDRIESAGLREVLERSAFEQITGRGFVWVMIHSKGRDEELTDLYEKIQNTSLNDLYELWKGSL